MKKQPFIERFLEVKAYSHKGISVAVEIDFARGTISLLEKNMCMHQQPKFSVKKWVFAGRQLEYMQGWQNILDAMKYAIAEAEKELRAYTTELDKLKKESTKKLKEAIIGAIKED